MIKIDDIEVKVEFFPDGTPRFDLSDFYYIFNGNYSESIRFQWNYESNEELVFLYFLKSHFNKYFSKEKMELFIPYLPNARMDRTKAEYEVFTLKYFCNLINMMEFHRVFVYDIHSDVSMALLDNCLNRNPASEISTILTNIPGVSDNEYILYFPDAGAAKRYSKMFPALPYCYGEKDRDWKTGKIRGLKIRDNGIDLKGKTVMMIDDICSYGGSLHYSALELQKYEPDKIHAFVSHCENSVLDKEKGTLIKDLENNTVERLFTTDSIYTGECEKISVIYLK